MFFEKLEDKQLYYRSIADYKLVPNMPVLVMLDGRSFSKLIKNKFKKPFDEDFIDMMNKTAAYLCKNVTGCKFAYVQSDEISLYLCDFENIKSDSFFGYRLCKMQSILSAMATGRFNQLMTEYRIKELGENPSVEDIMKIISETKLAEFDSKCWNVPDANDVFGWFLYRQIDCVRNSKQQAAQTYLSHKSLMNLDTDKQIAKLLEEKGVDWNLYPESQKYGRIIYKETETFYNEERNIEYERSVWKTHDMWLLTQEGSKDRFRELNLIPNL